MSAPEIRVCGSCDGAKVRPKYWGGAEIVPCHICGATGVVERCSDKCDHGSRITETGGLPRLFCTHHVLSVLAPKRPMVSLVFEEGNVPAWCPARSAKVAAEMLLVCPICGIAYHPGDLNGGDKRDRCFTCHHFTHERGPNSFVVATTAFEAHPSKPESVTFAARQVYTLGKEPAPGASRDGLGFGGRRFELEVIDGPDKGKRIVSHNVWSGGSVPKHLWHLLPVTAVLVRGE